MLGHAGGLLVGVCSGDFRPCLVNSQYQPSQSRLFILFCFEMESHVAQADFKLAIAEDVLELLLTLHNLPFKWVTVVYHHAWFMWCWELNLSLPMELHHQPQLFLCKKKTTSVPFRFLIAQAGLEPVM